MEDVGTSFFHMLCSAILFTVAFLWLMVGVRSVTARVTVCREFLQDEAVYEDSQQEALLVSGEYVMAYLMAEPQYAVCVRQGESVVMLYKGRNPAQNLMTAGIVPDRLYRMSYEYDRNEGIIRLWVIPVEK